MTGKLSKRIEDVYSWLENVTGVTLSRLDIEEVHALERRSDAHKRILEAAKQAEMLLDGMALEGIRNSLSLPVQQLYSSVHIALQEALATEGEGNK